MFIDLLLIHYFDDGTISTASVTINVDHIISISRYSNRPEDPRHGNASIKLVGYSTPMVVSESYDTVRELIRKNRELARRKAVQP